MTTTKRRRERQEWRPDLGLLAARLTRSIEDELFERLEERGFEGIAPRHGAVLSYLDEDGIRATDLAELTGRHKQHEHEKLVEFYRRRSYFHDPYVGPWMILSAEELATLFHIPSSTVETPTLPRIQSATSGAPANLPT